VTATVPSVAAEPEATINTIADLPFVVMGRFPKPLIVGRCAAGKIDGFSSKELFERIRDLSLGLSALGVASGDRVAIVAESRPEWLLADLAILTLGAVTVPIYPTLSAAQARYILMDSAAKIAFVSTRVQVDKLQEVRHELPSLQAIVVMDGSAAIASPSVTSMDALAERGHHQIATEWGIGKAFKDRSRSIGHADLATIIYTSGTTGEPKGVMLTHGNLVSNLKAASEVLSVNQEDVALSFLPLSHAFERMVMYVYLAAGVTITFAESFDTIARDIAAVRPTLLTGVPRVYEKLYARINEKGQSVSQWQKAKRSCAAPPPVC
jgi:long-chain acyl-CoA synthetase